jgi:hypothetical protein
MEFNELEELIASKEVGQTLKGLYTNLHLAKKEDRPKNIQERDWTHKISNARSMVSNYLLVVEKGLGNFSENASFDVVKTVNPKMYNDCLKFIIENYNKLGVLF